MKKILLIFSFLILTASLSLYAQPCLPEGLVLTKQVDVDNFKINYPNCTKIEGDLEIGSWSNSDITNLDSLDVLTSVWGELKIANNDDLISLNGLHNITAIGGDLRIYSNPKMADMSGLEGLDVVRGHFYISELDSLQNLTGLENLDTIGLQLTLSGNGLLQNLNGLQNLKTIENSLFISSNDTLANLYGIDNLADIGSAIWIWQNKNLSEISALEQIENALISITIRENDSLKSLYGLHNVKIDSLQLLTIFYNHSLSVCDVGNICDYLVNPTGMVSVAFNAPGCQNAPEIAGNCGFTLSCLPFGHYYFTKQDDIDNYQSDYQNCSELNGSILITGKDINNLDGLGSVMLMGSGEYGGLYIRDTEELTDLSGMGNLTEINGSLSFSNNIGLASPLGLDNIININGDLSFYACPDLKSFDGLSNLSTVNGQLRLSNNPILRNLEGLLNISSVTGSFYISNNDSLSSLDGVNSLETIGGRLQIQYNQSLKEITNLENLKFIGSELRITSNDSLTSLSGIDNIEASSIEEINISYNPLLSTCEVESICNYLATPGGSISIFDNTEGCNSRIEVEEACETVVVEENISNKALPEFRVYPNPFSDVVNIEFKLEDLTYVNISIYNQVGKEVYRSKKNHPGGQHRLKWNSAPQQPGIYYLRLEIDGSPASSRLVKIR